MQCEARKQSGNWPTNIRFCVKERGHEGLHQTAYKEVFEGDYEPPASTTSEYANGFAAGLHEGERQERARSGLVRRQLERAKQALKEELRTPSHGRHCIRSEGDWLCGGGCPVPKAERDNARIEKVLADIEAMT